MIYFLLSSRCFIFSFSYCVAIIRHIQFGIELNSPAIFLRVSQSTISSDKNVSLLLLKIQFQVRVSPYFWYLFWNYLKGLLRRRESSRKYQVLCSKSYLFFFKFYFLFLVLVTLHVCDDDFLCSSFSTLLLFLPKTPLSPLLHKNWVQCVRSSSFLFWLLINSIIFLKLTSFYYILVCQMFIPNRRVAVNFIYTYILFYDYVCEHSSQLLFINLFNI